jgi:uncharacterized protein YnzC (UPF0291/DUF896 family)
MKNSCQNQIQKIPNYAKTMLKTKGLTASDQTERKSLNNHVLIKRMKEATCSRTISTEKA